MTLIEEIRQLKPTTKDLRSFGVVVGGAFVVFWAVIKWVLPRLLGHGGDFPALWMIGAALAVVGAVAPIVLRPVYYVWMTLALAMGFVMTRVILTLFFFLVLTPVGLVFKVIGRDALHRKLDREGSTYWIDKEYLIDDHTRLEKFF